jgi:hypothetical protein
VSRYNQTLYLGSIVATPGALAALRETNVDPLSLFIPSCTARLGRPDRWGHAIE